MRGVERYAGDDMVVVVVITFAHLHYLTGPAAATGEGRGATRGASTQRIEDVSERQPREPSTALFKE